MSEQLLLQPLIYYVGAIGASGFIGLAMGYALKKMMKGALVILGALSLFLAYLGYKGLVEVDWIRVSEESQGLAESALNESQGMITYVASQFDGSKVAVVGMSMFSFVAAFMMGLKKG